MSALRPAFWFGVAFSAVIWLSTAPLEALAGSEAQLFDSVNQLRAARDLIPLHASSELAAVALAHAKDMAARGYLSHENPEGHNPLDRVQAAGVTGFRLLAENIGSSTVGGDRVQAIVDGWMGSHDHRENLLNPAFNTAGVAVVAAPDGRTIAVELYATFPTD